MWGVPGLSEAELERLRLGNATMRISVRIVCVAICAAPQTDFENPAASYLWQVPPLASVLSAGQRVIVDYGSYGTS